MATKKQVLINFVKDNLKLNKAASLLSKLSDRFLETWVPKMSFEEFRVNNPFMKAINKFDFPQDSSRLESIFVGVYNAYTDDRDFYKYVDNRNEVIFSNKNLGRYTSDDITRLVKYDIKNPDDFVQLKTAVDNGLAKRQLRNISNSEKEKIRSKAKDTLKELTKPENEEEAIDLLQDSPDTVKALIALIKRAANNK